MGVGFSISNFLLPGDDRVNGFPYPEDLTRPNWIESFSDADLQVGLATAVLIGKETEGGGFDPVLTIYEDDGFTPYTLIDKNDDGFGNSNSLITEFFIFPDTNYIAAIESFDASLPSSVDYYFEVQVDDAGNELFSFDTYEFGPLNGTESFSDFVGLSDVNDFYSFILASESEFNASLLGLTADADLVLLDSVGNTVAVSSGSGDENIALTLNTGTYYLRVVAFNGDNPDQALASGDVATNYLLEVSADPTTPPPPEPGTVQFSQASYQVNENAGTSNVLTLTRTDNTAIASQVLVNITGGSATAGSDYTNSSFPLTVNFGVGETSKTIAVPVLEDSLDEVTETVTFSVTGVNNATIGSQSTTTLQILDNDLPDDGGGDDDDKTIKGTSGQDILNGGSGNDKILGLKGDDRLTGNEGNDKLVGGDGKDQLIGGKGKDFLDGAEGKDILFGDKGKDIFVIGRDDGRDKIKDFQDNQDLLDLNGYKIKDLGLIRKGKNTLIVADNEDLALLSNVNPNQISTADFL